MIEFGETLRKAREAKGYTTAQLAQKTHLMAQQIEALEREDFSRIAAPIYGRGFVKLYCEAVEIDPKPLVAEFMEIFSGNRPPTIRYRPAPAQKPPEPPPAPPREAAPEPATPPAAPAADAPAAEPSPSPAPAFTAAPAPEPALPSEPAFTLESEIVPPQPAVPPAGFPPSRAGRPASRYAPPVPLDDDDESRGFHLPYIPRRVRRMLVLAGVAILLLWLVIAGCRAVWSSVNEPSEAEQPAPEAGRSPAAEPGGSGRITRPVSTGIYID